MFTGKGKQLSVFVTETDQYHHRALHMAIVEMLRREGCSGATDRYGRSRWLRRVEPHPHRCNTAAVN